MEQNHPTAKLKDFVFGLSGQHLNQLNWVDGRSMRRAAKRKRRIEAKKQESSNKLATPARANAEVV